MRPSHAAAARGEQASSAAAAAAPPSPAGGLAVAVADLAQPGRLEGVTYCMGRCGHAGLSTGAATRHS